MYEYNASLLNVGDKSIRATHNKQKNHGQHRAPEKLVKIKKHICLYYNIDKKKRKTNIYILFEMLDQKALQDFNDIYP